jgi:hypothetical protein
VRAPLRRREPGARERKRERKGERDGERCFAAPQARDADRLLGPAFTDRRFRVEPADVTRFRRRAAASRPGAGGQGGGGERPRWGWLGGALGWRLWGPAAAVAAATGAAELEAEATGEDGSDDEVGGSGSRTHAAAGSTEAAAEAAAAAAAAAAEAKTQHLLVRNVALSRVLVHDGNMGFDGWAGGVSQELYKAKGNKGNDA